MSKRIEEFIKIKNDFNLKFYAFYNDFSKNICLKSDIYEPSAEYNVFYSIKGKQNLSYGQHEKDNYTVLVSYYYKKIIIEINPNLLKLNDFCLKSMMSYFDIKYQDHMLDCILEQKLNMEKRINIINLSLRNMNLEFM